MTNPKKLFLIDGLGAILSAFFLGVVLVRLESVFGIPTTTLYILAIIPIFFAIYDLYFYTTSNKDTGPFLKTIALLNILYCFVSIGFAFYHLDRITILGWLYILVETTIIIALANIEYKAGKKAISKK